MPGLNQLKQFSEDIREVGDEVKIRAQRGEKVPVIPLPQGISEEDDSEDFIIGLPEQNNGEEDDAAENVNAPSDADSIPVDLDSLDVDADIAALLNPQATADEDALADFLNDDLASPAPEAAPAEPEPAAEETPLEDMDLDSLLQGTGTEESPEQDSSESELTKAAPEAPAPSSTEPPEIDSFTNSELGDLSGLSDFEALGNPDDFGGTGDSGMETAPDSEEPASAPADDFSLPGDLGADFSLDQMAEDAPGSEPVAPEADALETDALETPAEIPSDEMSLDGADFNAADSAQDSSSGDSASSLPDMDMSMDGIPDMPDLSGMDSPSDSGSDDIFSMDLDALAEGNDSTGSLDSSEPSDSSDAAPEIPDAFDEVPDEKTEAPADENAEIALDTFDTSGMDDVDFGSSNSASGEEFPATDDGLGGDDDFVLDSSFEIPGFSDTETADMGKKKPLLDTVDFSKGKEGRAKNSLTEDEYVQFKKNLANYPLNLRIALEDFIARDEFTDEAVFEIIEKVLKKTSARQLATQLEKILDISINIPRDFERRSYAEYEAYKQSFSYQLKNRIIPAAIVGVILAFVCFGLFKAGQHFIYEPVMANIHYKQGYTLLEANEFPQSEDEFATAVKYRAVKKWFFKYAVGYRNKKQYERAAKMYKNILAVFDHDKQAGLDYAEMELYDRANYERAEEIVRREVLDYHINDADGILMLGDVFLEWAELDSSKYELAKEQYLDLIQRYGNGVNNVYLSRMMRYNIRTDKLREVIYYKNIFYQGNQDKQNLKNLGAADWTELSGYMLEKLYGALSKNDEYLRSSIEDVLAMLNLAIRSDPSNPVARYNLARYYIQNGITEQAKIELERSLELFEKVPVRTKKNVYREINATRVLGELYADNHEYLKAQTVYTRGINLYNEEHEASELEGDADTGKLFADMGDLDYFISGELDDALYNYEKAIEIKNDTPSINYRVGAIYYNRKNYDNALMSFLKVVEKEPRDPNILLSLGNVLSIRGDNFAAESYYEDLLHVLDQGREKQKLLLPQDDDDDYAVVDLYLKANNNLGITKWRLAQQTGDSARNAEAIVRLSDSIRAWDALTRNQKTMIRMEGSNLAAQNSKYITHPYPDFEPAIYTDIPRLLAGEKGLE